MASWATFLPAGTQERARFLVKFLSHGRAKVDRMVELLQEYTTSVRDSSAAVRAVVCSPCPSLLVLKKQTAPCVAGVCALQFFFVIFCCCQFLVFFFGTTRGQAVRAFATGARSTYAGMSLDDVTTEFNEAAGLATLQKVGCILGFCMEGNEYAAACRLLLAVCGAGWGWVLTLLGMLAQTGT